MNWMEGDGLRIITLLLRYHCYNVFLRWGVFDLCLGVTHNGDALTAQVLRWGEEVEETLQALRSPRRNLAIMRRGFILSLCRCF